MGRVRGKDTKPEIIVRKIAHSLGYRFRLHRSDLPGSPDLSFPSRKKVIFVHGCYWHRHQCKKATTPKTNTAFWLKKFEQNIARDMKNQTELADRGWESLVIWECETGKKELVATKLVEYLGVVA